MSSLTDTHCHLDVKEFEADFEDVIGRARNAGITRILNPGTDLNSSAAAIELATRWQEIYAAVGVHPNDGMIWDEDTLAELHGLAEQPKVVAIGEIGLDFYRDYCPAEIQYKILDLQLDLAAKMALPVIIHIRQAMQPALERLKIWTQRLSAAGSPLANRPGVLHSFDGSLDQAQMAVEMGFYLGIGGPITYRNSQERQEIVRALPLENLLIETDAPYLSPHPFRGQRNEPARVEQVIQKIADLKNCTAASVAEITSSNADRLFVWGDRN